MSKPISGIYSFTWTDRDVASYRFVVDASPQMGDEVRMGKITSPQDPFGLSEQTIDGMMIPRRQWNEMLDDILRERENGSEGNMQ